MRRLAVSLVAVGVALAACGSPTHPGGQVRVVASTTAWGAVAAAVVGNDAQVRSIIDNPAQDPHSYDASAADAAAIADAQVVVYNGGGYDPFVDAVLDDHANVERIDAFAVGGHQPGANPHVFYDLDTVSAVAGALADHLAAIDPAHGEDYKANAQKFAASVDGVLAAEHAIATAHPGAASTATEDVAGYLEAATGLTDKTPPGYYKAISVDADPSPADIGSVLDLITGRAVQVVLSNPQTTTAVTKRVVDAARSARIPVVEVTETLPAGMDFVSWQHQTVDRLSAALQHGDKHRP
jgi:zinc/manganese transport system substrate-binding protein